MTLQLGEIAPDFTVESTEGNIRFHEWLGEDWARDIEITQCTGPNFSLLADKD